MTDPSPNDYHDEYLDAPARHVPEKERAKCGCLMWPDEAWRHDADACLDDQEAEAEEAEAQHEGAAPDDDGGYVFVYGTLRRGGLHHGVLGRSALIGPATIEGRLLDLGLFPGFVPGDGRVIGEVYEVTAETLADLDRLEGVGRTPPLYHRERREVTLEPGRVVDVWVYVYARPYAPSLVLTTGDWLAHFDLRVDPDTGREYRG